jgi:hypothetical protein
MEEEKKKKNLKNYYKKNNDFNKRKILSLKKKFIAMNDDVYGFNERLFNFSLDCDRELLNIEKSLDSSIKYMKLFLEKN